MIKSLMQVLLHLCLIGMVLMACTHAPIQATIASTPELSSTTLGSTPKAGFTPGVTASANVPPPQPTASITSTPTLTPTAEIWQIQSCQLGSSMIGLEDDWFWEYTGEIEGRGEVAMLLNFTNKNEILGFVFDSGEVHEYRVNGCVLERNFIMWLSLEGTVEAIIQGEFPATDPRGLYGPDQELQGEFITGLLVEKGQRQGFPVFLSLLRGTGGTMQHRFWLAGVKDDTLILNASQRFLSAIASNDRDRVVEMIAFPVQVRIHLDESSEIQTPERFLAQYDALFDDSFKDRLAVTFPNYLVAIGGNYLGWIGLSVYGGGVICFNNLGQVVSIANWETSELPPTP